MYVIETKMLPRPADARFVLRYWLMPFFVRVVSCELYVCNVVLLRVFRVFRGSVFIKRTTNHISKDGFGVKTQIDCTALAVFF